MAGKLERYSVRVGVAVNMAIRLFESSAAEEAYRPKTGAGAWEPGDPQLWEEGNPGEPGYRRIWTVPQPKGGPKVVTQASSAFELVGDPPRRALELPDLDPPTATRSQAPAIISSDADGSVLMPNVLCRKAHFRWNSHRVADELELELPIAALPLPPDGSVIRSILVEARVGVIDADSWALALSEGAVDVDGRPLSLPVVSDSIEPDFAGFADDHTIHLPESGASTARLKCRGMDGILADEQCRGRSVETDVEIDYAIARLLSTMPSMVGMAVHWLGPTMPPSLGASGPTWKRRVSKKGKPLPLSPKNAKQSMLDLITEACIIAGVMPRVVGYRIELGPAKTLDQYTAQTVPRMVLGHNLLDLELSHKLTQGHAKAVEIRSFNPDSGRICAARFPPDPNRTGDLPPGQINTAPPSGPLNLPPGTSAADEQTPEVFLVENVTDPAKLLEIAENFWQERARQDVSGKFSTRDIATIEGRAQGVADLLSIRSGDPISIVIAPDTEQAAGSYLQRIAAMGRSAAIDMLEGAGWSGRAAESVVDAIQIAKRPLIYRVREADLKVAMDGPVELDVQLQSFIEVVDRHHTVGTGGHRKVLAEQAKKRDVSFVEAWEAIELDRQAGEISDADALEMQKSVGDFERQRRRAARLRTWGTSAGDDA